MNTFHIIQEFFTRMSCNYCQAHFEPKGIELVREDDGVFIVSVYCHSCDRPVGIAMVGVETNGKVQVDPTQGGRFKDPELTEDEMDRLSAYEAISEDDVLDAHSFFQQLDEGWMDHIPEHLKNCLEEPIIDPETADSETTIC